VTKPDQSAIDSFLDDVHLLDVNQMKELFPEAEIRKEKFLGMTKSIIALRR
jgi:hypothetical protein